MKISARDIDHVSATLGDLSDTATKLGQLCFQPGSDEIPNYIELLEGEATRISLALNVAELAGEERTHSWETEDGFEVDAGVVVGESGGPLPWFPVRHETPDAFMEPEWIVHPNGAL